jgi:hypothetical protein
MSSSISTQQGHQFVNRLLESSPAGVAQTFTTEQLEAIRQVFTAGGYSSANSSDDHWQGPEVEEDEPGNLAVARPASPSPHDRRRPGRDNSLYPTLISLLRRPTSPIDAEPDHGDLRPAVGVVLIVVLSLAFWIIVVIAILLLIFV